MESLDGANLCMGFDGCFVNTYYIRLVILLELRRDVITALVYHNEVWWSHIYQDLQVWVALQI